ncbi:hypothetical protein K2Z84_01085 [Candidatus Binatia bacterium]|nr:hypothetical protein [Candidatus Binatia bacterium]
MVILTAILVLIAFLQWRAFVKQLRAMSDGLKVASANAQAAAEGAKAAQTSADAMVAFERPWVVSRAEGPPRHAFSETIRKAIGLGGEVDTSEPDIEPTANSEFRISVRLRDYGKSPAWLIDIGCSCGVVPMPVSEPAPAVSPPSHGSRLLTPGGKGHRVTVSVELSPADRQAMTTGPCAIAVIGSYRYRDPRGVVSRSGFCYLYSRIGGLHAPRGEDPWKWSSWFVTDGPAHYFRTETENENEGEAAQKGSRHS